MFKAIGAILALYLVYAFARGEVVVKAGVWGKRIERSRTPRAFWLYLGIYALLVVALFTVF